MSAARTSKGKPHVPGWVRNHGLGLVFGVLLLAVLVAQSFAGVAQYNADAVTNGLQQISLWQYVASSDFAVDVAENWQSEFLQFSLYIWLTVWLVEDGSPESKPLGDVGRESDEQQQVGRFAEAGSPAWARAGGWRTAVFSHSLTYVMGAIFFLSWGAQFVAGHAAYNEQQLAQLQQPVTALGYLQQADFWDRTFQNWQSELLAVGSMAVLSVYLRERGSPESKPVGAPHRETATSG